MVGDHRTSERVYARLKADLLSRALCADGINIAVLADLYDASVTPVREALLRLVGEHLVHMPASGGFTIPRVDPTMALDCYELSQVLTLQAVRLRRSGTAACDLATAPSLLKIPIDAVIEGLARATGNDVFVATISSLNDRMHPLRLMEEARLPGLSVEFEQLLKSVESKDPKVVSRNLNKYHRRRQRNVPRILGI